ncbi:MAG: glycosyltransferase [Rhodospirillales bacterium]|nr:glycosyltransferase [Rhodospirillales bacterium]
MTDATVAPPAEPVAYVMKRYPRLTETFILNEIRAMERLGARLHIFSLLAPEPPPHHPMAAEVTAPLHSPPQAGWAKFTGLARAHAAALAAAPLRYLGAVGRAMVFSALSPTPMSVWKQFGRAGFVATTCRRAGIRHIHAHFANAPAAVARFASMMSGIPFSFTAHAKDLYLTPKRVIQRRAGAATFVATCTGYNAQYLRDLVGLEQADKIHLVYHGIDLGLFTPRSAPAAVPGRRKDHVPLILTVGRLVPKKGHDDLIAALARLRDRGVAFRCRIVGAGPLQHELAAEITRHGLGETVTLEGPMTHARLIGLYREADLFALAPRIADDGDRDGIPNVIAEAMAIGVPVVSTDVSGIPELVRNDDTGLVVPPRDPEALAGALARLLANPSLAARFAARARARLEEEFDLWTTTRRLHTLMEGDACCAGVHGEQTNPFVRPAPSWRRAEAVQAGD